MRGCPGVEGVPKQSEGHIQVSETKSGDFVSVLACINAWADCTGFKR